MNAGGDGACPVGVVSRAGGRGGAPCGSMAVGAGRAVARAGSDERRGGRAKGARAPARANTVASRRRRPRPPPAPRGSPCRSAQVRMAAALGGSRASAAALGPGLEEPAAGR